MTTIVKRIAAKHAGKLEEKINEFLSKPEGANCEVAAAFAAPDGDVVIIFQKA